MAKQENDTGQVIIKKYANRRLYNTSSSSYITLDDLARMTREGTDFKVLDAKTGNDITHAILTQIIMEEEAAGEQMLPVSFLRQLISMYGNSMQSLMPAYLEASMDSFRANQRKLQDTFSGGVGPDAFAKLAKTNMAMFEAATSAFIPNQGGETPSDGGSEPAADSASDLSELRKQMADIQKKLDKLGK
ncbi:polyhydroxyalkanoate synthesis repressor PhaR [Altericroceibacterium endophyticum]|uniref:Polyhydroxyalkanoate synthesis repressor PhaR n=1 Tax=Altericroceibacterium endophyticum TaxID=1808508 RepID=A0A6I4T0N6_9SPHN|nr:polyhydroxyalkanoate synthesis repressor PhaR [Altericroceibacterium endophyticum]MXO64488.1 polyhydroxyalkanoate synthesis repressor PhaR [Altericroceibacterium endophyticum]